MIVAAPLKVGKVLNVVVGINTGSKNAIKGVGFFLGGLLLDRLGFQAALNSPPQTGRSDP